MGQHHHIHIDDAWEEEQHPRGGNSKNRGQFSRGSGGTTGSSRAQQTAQRRASLHEQIQAHGRNMPRSASMANLERALSLLNGMISAKQAPDLAERFRRQSLPARRELLEKLRQAAEYTPSGASRMTRPELKRAVAYHRSRQAERVALQQREQEQRHEREQNPPSGKKGADEVKNIYSGRATRVTRADFEGMNVWSHDESIKVFNDHIRVRPKEFIRGLSSGLTPTSVGMRASGKRLTVSANLEGQGRLNRSFDFHSMSVDHAYFQLPRNVQGGGAAKQVLAGQMETYKQLGIKEITLHANIDVGSYAWAKYGFYPRVSDWHSFRGELQRKVTSLHLPRDVAGRVNTILSSDDPRAIWRLADLPDKVDGQSVAKRILMNTHWYATFKLDDELAMKRFNSYVGDR